MSRKGPAKASTTVLRSVRRSSSREATRGANVLELEDGSCGMARVVEEEEEEEEEAGELHDGTCRRGGGGGGGGGGVA